MLLNPEELQTNLPRVEEIEKASLRLVVQGIFAFRETAQEIFRKEQVTGKDWAADIAEDITREAMDRLGVSRIEARPYGKVDYKRARYVFHPEYAIRQVLFVDSKAEKPSGQSIARLQTSQVSMIIRQIRRNEPIEVPGQLPKLLEIDDNLYLTTTIVVKYTYDDPDGQRSLLSMNVAAVPNGMLQEKYNPTCTDTIWTGGPDSPARHEEFRTRLSFHRLKHKARWRVQTIPIAPEPFHWVD